MGYWRNLFLFTGPSIYDEGVDIFMVVENSIVMQLSTVLQGFLACVLSYFVFGLQYPKQLSLNLEFIQR